MLALERVGARPANGVAGVTQGADVVFTMLPASPEVELTVLGPDGILANARPKQIIVDMSTVEPKTTDLIAGAAAERGLSVMDAPVGRLAAHADRGESLFMVGASDEDFQRVLPMLRAMGTTIHDCGGVGTGIRSQQLSGHHIVSA
jgi:4-hydroxybutyrate dehydrogenase / sulfolactaldehyde 3-reductase